MKLIIFENSKSSRLLPFSFNHSPLELRLGAFTNLERFQRIYNHLDIILIVREDLKDIIEERYPSLSVNPEEISKGLCLNASAILKNEHLELIDTNDVLSNRDELISFKLEKTVSFGDFEKIIDRKKDVTIACDIPVIKNIWDIFEYQKTQLEDDFNYFSLNNNYLYHPSLIMVNQDYIYIGNNVTIKAGVIIDASAGPVIIDKDVIIDHGTIIEGPNYIGKGTYIAPISKIRDNNIIGPMCKVGGELTNNNFLGYSNKVHDGFLGHSYIGEWVNIGAGTNNSNLKNNYSLVKVRVENEIYKTDLQFLGSLIGDYTRIAIGTNLNTGTFIGIGSNIFNHRLQDNYIPSFSWGKDAKVQFENFINTLIKMKKRRGKSISSAEKECIKTIYSK
ncbi:MAG: hypothetical protein CMG66_04310 [Candidatus Marinimicrobia bacterium]|nr:hypothetical protein [Candidatus Neomarinimicrobiota bacterium]|tara:strand:+ start:9860 stop:11032 length:1173 start_codon:yes stop_codon:yes gene_type:complete